MSNMAHTFNPTDDSLQARVSAYRATVEAYKAAKRSLNRLDNPEWRDRLGDKEEVLEALQIARNSLILAYQSLSKGDIQKAESSGLLSESESKEYFFLARQQEIENLRSNSNLEDSDTSKHQR